MSASLTSGKEAAREEDQIVHGLAQNQAQAVTQQYADNAAHAAEDGGFHQKLTDNLPTGGTDGLLDADLPGTLGHGDQHDVHNADAAHQQGNTGNAAQHHAHGGHLLGGLGHGGVAVLQFILPTVEEMVSARKTSRFAMTASMLSDLSTFTVKEVR